MRDKEWPVDFLLKENPDWQWDDLHDVRELANTLSGMVYDLEETVDRLEKENRVLKEENKKLREYINKR